MAATGGLLLQILRAALLLAAAPLADGLTRWVKARLDGRRGPPPVQPYRDLLRALRRRPALATGASPFSAGAPLLAVGALALAAGLLPPVAFLGSAPALLGPAPAGPPVGMAAPPPVSGDLVLIAALLGLSRFASALALLDAGTAAAGLGAARLLARPALFDPALLLVALCAATLAGAEASGAGAPFGAGAPLLLAAAAVLLVAAAEAPRPPVAGEEPPHDLGQAPEAVGAEFSGWHLAAWDYARALRCTLFLALLAALLPGPPAAASGAVGTVLGALIGLAKLASICVLLAAVESGLAVLRPERLPVLGVGALVLAVVAAALLLLGGAAA